MSCGESERGRTFGMYWSNLQAGSEIRFRLSDVACPDQGQVFERLTGDLEVSGRVVFISDSGDKRDHYAVVEVDGVLSPLIVPIETVLPALAG
jgi:hypothetical protein